MSIRDSIAKLEPGDRIMIDSRYQVNYVRMLAKEHGKTVKQLKLGGAWEISCIGYYADATLAWLRRLRRERKAKQRWREKTRYQRKLAEYYNLSH
jgi:hypothetical protein